MVHAAGILMTHGKRGLFLKRSDKSKDHAGEWCCPGGSIEEGESPEQAARRELQEETGLISGDLNQIDEGEGFVTFRQNVDAEAMPKLNDEHSEAMWAPLNDPPHPLHPGVAATLKKLLATAISAGERETIAEKESQAAGAEEGKAQKKAAALLDGALDKREYDTNNWFEVFDNPLSKVGVYKYSEAKVIKGGDPSKMVGVFRPPEELGSEECIKSFRLMPWTDDHPRDLLGDPDQGFVPVEEKGVKGVIGEQVYFKDDTLYGNLKVFSEELARKISSGKRQLSCGYHCEFVPQEGVYKGVPYVYVQKNMRGNHVASVTAGRMGSDVRVLDAAEHLSFAFDMKEIPMTACADCGRTHAASEDCMDAETQKFVADSFNSLVGELEKKGYSKEYATKVAGKVAAEKGATGHDSTGDMTMPKAKDAEIKDPEGKEDPKEKQDLMGGKGATKDAMTSEEEEGMDEDKDKEKDDGKKEVKDSDEEKNMSKDEDEEDEKPKKAAKDSKTSKGMDAAEVAALVRREVAKATPDTSKLVAKIRREENAKAKTYGQVSTLIGAFDHAEMTHEQMASYALKKLGAPTTASDPVTALEYYLAGRSQVLAPVRSSAQDASGESFLDKYLTA